MVVDAGVDGGDALDFLVVQGVLDDRSRQVRADLADAVAGPVLYDSHRARGRDCARSATAGRLLQILGTVIGGIVGAAVGSQMGGGSGRYATSAIGSMVGGMAGQQVYENSVRQRQQQRPQTATVQVCDPVPAGDRYYGTSGSGVTAYDVTYEYAGRSYTTRMNHHPGDRVRVRVDVAE